MNILEVLERGMSRYCENGVGIFSTQPINTISNIIIFVSAYFAYRYIRIHHVKSLTILLLPLILVVTGVGSILWHGMPNLLTSLADTLPLSIFVLISFFFLLNKILPNRSWTWGILSGFVLMEFPFIFGVFPSLNGFLPYSMAFSLGLFVFFGLAKKYKTLLFQLVPIVPLFAIALFFRTVDLTTCSTFPTGTHFIWHTLNAFVFYVLIRFLVEIEKKEQKT